MFSYLKIKIISWYTSLLTVILAATLFGSYELIGYQLKSDVLYDLKIKLEFVNNIIREGVRTEREAGAEHQDQRDEDRNEHPRRKFNLSDLQLYTDIADDNYILFIYNGDCLTYLTEKYKNIRLHVSPFEIPDKQIVDIELNDMPFSMIAIHQPGYTIYIGYELSALTGLQSKLLKIFLIAFPVGVLLSIICGFFVTQRSMKVISKISETTDRITSNNLSERIETPKGNDEISRLISTLNLMINRLEKSFNQAKQLSQDTAHEIRTPLTIIRGEIEELIERETTDDKTASKLKSILEEVQYLSSISNRLLLMHIMDTDQIKFNFEIINLSELVNEIYQDAVVISSDRKLEIKLDIVDNVELTCNKELITRLLWNITDNAIKYNNPQGMLNFKLFKEKSNVCIQISDTGIGIPAEEIPKIFDRFYRVDKSRSRELRGSGLGLAICKWIADLHDAVITVESEIDKRSTFTIIFPIP
jgi:signal transduction histidine kinase